MERRNAVPSLLHPVTAEPAGVPEMPCRNRQMVIAVLIKSRNTKSFVLAASPAWSGAGEVVRAAGVLVR